MNTGIKSNSLFEGADINEAIMLSFKRLAPQYQLRNPVMFLVFVGSIITTLIFAAMLVDRHTIIGGNEPLWFVGAVTFWLWFTLIFANFA